MPSIIKGFEYDIFISYRQKDNVNGWVTEFVKALNNEIESTFKEDINIYFDENPHDGLHEHHEVDDSLSEKLRSIILIPIVSQTYCDPNAFAWASEFKVFVEQASTDSIGLKAKLKGGNVASRVLPVRIHELDDSDRQMFEGETGSPMRSIDFIYSEAGVNRPLEPRDNKQENLNKTDYRNQVNKVANAIKELLYSLKNSGTESVEEVTSPAQKIETSAQKRSSRKISSPKISGKQKRLAARAFIIIILAVAVFLAGRISISPEEANIPLLRYHVPLDQPLNRTGRHALDISPDGKFVVMAKDIHFYKLNLDDSSDPIPIAGTFTETYRSPEISPDGKWICFEDLDNKLMKLPINGGTPTKICEVRSTFGINWIGNHIYFGEWGAIYRVPDSGGEPIQLYPPEGSDRSLSIWSPQIMSDGETLLFNQKADTVGADWNVMTWKLGSTEEANVLVRNGHDARFLSNGDITYVNDGRLYIDKYDFSRDTLAGSAEILASDLPLMSGERRTSQYSFSDNGVLVYSRSQTISMYNIAWVDQKGNVETITKTPEDYDEIHLSPEGDKILAAAGDDPETIHVIDVNLGTAYAIAEDGEDAAWANDGNSFYTETDNDFIRQHFLDAGIAPRDIAYKAGLFEICRLSQEGRYLAFASRGDLGYVDLQTDSLIMLDYYNTDGIERSPSLSPDGKWLVYEHDTQGLRNELYVVPFPGPGPRYKIPGLDGHFAVWAPDQSAIYFNGHGITGSPVWKVNVNVDGTEFSTSEPEELFTGKFANGIDGKFDIHPDGDRFLMVVPAGNTEDHRLEVIANWQQLLENQ